MGWNSSRGCISARRGYQLNGDRLGEVLLYGDWGARSGAISEGRAEEWMAMAGRRRSRGVAGAI